MLFPVRGSKPPVLLKTSCSALFAGTADMDTHNSSATQSPTFLMMDIFLTPFSKQWTSPGWGCLENLGVSRSVGNHRAGGEHEAHARSNPKGLKDDLSPGHPRKKH